MAAVAYEMMVLTPYIRLVHIAADCTTAGFYRVVVFEFRIAEHAVHFVSVDGVDGRGLIIHIVIVVAATPYT